MYVLLSSAPTAAVVPIAPTAACTLATRIIWLCGCGR